MALLVGIESRIGICSQRKAQDRNCDCGCSVLTADRNGDAVRVRGPQKAPRALPTQARLFHWYKYTFGALRIWISGSSA